MNRLHIPFFFWLAFIAAQTSYTGEHINALQYIILMFFNGDVKNKIKKYYNIFSRKKIF
jgi:hypothetical protein